jgi:hypothetical protein
MVLRNLTNTLRTVTGTVTAGVSDWAAAVTVTVTIQVALPLRLISGLGNRASD